LRGESPVDVAEYVAPHLERDTAEVTRISAAGPGDIAARELVEPTGAPVAPADSLGRAVDAAIRGEAWGWDALFDRYHGRVYAFAMARTGDRAAAEEVAQEVFVAAVSSIGGLRQRAPWAVEAWFLRIARFKLVDRARRAAREARPLDPPPPPADPGEAATTRLIAAEVRAAMESLTDDQREVLVRRFVFDESLEEVAARTRRSVGAVKAMQHRAMAALAKRLERRGVA